VSGPHRQGAGFTTKFLVPQAIAPFQSLEYEPSERYTRVIFATMGAMGTFQARYCAARCYLVVAPATDLQPNTLRNNFQLRNPKSIARVIGSRIRKIIKIVEGKCDLRVYFLLRRTLVVCHVRTFSMCALVEHSGCDFSCAWTSQKSTRRDHNPSCLKTDK